MDSFWQQHRTFVLKILAGLAVCLVFWIVGASMNDKGLEARDRENRRKVGALKGRPVASPEDRRAYEAAVETVRSRIHFLARKVGETRKGPELRTGLIRDLLRRVGKDTEEVRNRLFEEARGNPQGCFSRLLALVRPHLRNEAGRRNVILDEDLGFTRVEVTPAELDRYLLTLDTIVKAVNLAIEEEVYEVKQVSYGSPPGGRFEGEAVFLREYPVTVEVRGPASTVLGFVARLSDDDRFLPVGELRRLGRASSERDRDVITAEVQILALRIDPEGELDERLP